MHWVAAADVGAHQVDVGGDAPAAVVRPPEARALAASPVPRTPFPPRGAGPEAAPSAAAASRPAARSRGRNGALPYPSHTANQHSDGVAVNRARTSARLAAWRGGSDPIDGGASQIPGLTLASTHESPVPGDRDPFHRGVRDASVCRCHLRPCNVDAVAGRQSRSAGWSTRAYASKVTGSSDPTSLPKSRTLATIQSALLTSSTRCRSPKASDVDHGRKYVDLPATLLGFV